LSADLDPILLRRMSPIKRAPLYTPDKPDQTFSQQD